MDLNCRVCLQVSDVMLSIFEEVEQYKKNFATLLEECCDMDAYKHDCFPKYICQKCAQELLIVAEFHGKCKQTKKLLLEMFEKENKQENVTSQTTNTHNLVSYDALNFVCESLSEHSTEILSNESADQKVEEMLAELTQESSELTADQIDLNSNESVKQTKEDNVVLEQEEEQDIQILFETDELENSNENENSHDISREIQELETELIGMEMPQKTTESHHFICEICGAKFSKSFNLKRHMSTVHGKKSEFTCNCEIDFQSEKLFSEHICSSKVGVQCHDKIITHTSLEEEKKCVCIICGKRSQTPFALQMHMRTHSGERPFVCDICCSAFKTQSAMCTHRKRHTEQPSFRCSYCDKRFFTKSNLNAHIQTHTGERPHTCNVCHKSFSRVFLLQIHTRSHTGERPYSCQYCTQKFAQRSDLNSHMTKHTGNRKYKCTLCPKTFVRPNQLRHHLEKHGITETTYDMEKNPIFDDNVVSINLMDLLPDDAQFPNEQLIN